MHKFIVITLFPELFASFMENGVIGNAFKSNLVELTCINPRDYTEDRHRTVDDVPYGGGPGMVLKPEPLVAAIKQAKQQLPTAKVCYLSPAGKKLNDGMARELATDNAMILLCGRYLGIDQRVIDLHVDMEISLGDYITSGGELPAMVLMDAILRHVPGVLGDEKSLAQESFSAELLAPPCYTRPAEFEGQQVPEQLLSGNHAEIEQWRKAQAKLRTATWQKINKRKKAN